MLSTCRIVFPFLKHLTGVWNICYHFHSKVVKSSDELSCHFVALRKFSFLKRNLRKKKKSGIQSNSSKREILRSFNQTSTRWAPNCRQSGLLMIVFLCDLVLLMGNITFGYKVEHFFIETTFKESFAKKKFKDFFRLRESFEKIGKVKESLLLEFDYKFFHICCTIMRSKSTINFLWNVRSGKSNWLSW